MPAAITEVDFYIPLAGNAEKIGLRRADGTTLEVYLGDSAIVGPPGVQGLQGPPGAVGPQGPGGPQGVPGAVGPAGLLWKGAWDNATAYAVNDSVGWGRSSYYASAGHAAGSAPPTGVAGAPDPDDTAVNAGWALLSSEGAQGLQGIPGIPGAAGPPGANGADGAAGAIGPQGNTGAVGPQGNTGAVGPQGPAGGVGPAGPNGPMTVLNDVDDVGPVAVGDTPRWDGDSFAFQKTVLYEDPRLLDIPMSAALRVFRKALATRGTTPCDICFVGDSITEGYFQGALDVSIWPQYTRQLLQRLNVANGMSGGEGFIPARHTVTTPAMEARWVLSAGVDVTPNPLYGLGLRSAILHPGDTATLSFTGTRLKVAYTQKPAAGTLHVVVDGGADNNVSAANAVTKSGRILDSAVVLDLPGVPHTAVVTAVGGDVVLDGGFVCRADETTGIRVWPGGHSGYTAVHFADPTKLWDGILETINMDLVVVFLGVNDFNTGQTAAQYQANLITIGQRIKDQSAVDPSIVFIVPWPSSGTTDLAFRPFADAARVAARYHGAGVIDLWEALGTPDGSTIWYDGTHPGIYGSLAVSEAVTRQLLGTEQDYPFDHAARHRTGGRDPLCYQVRKVNSQIVNNTVGLTDDLELFLDLPANTAFEFEAVIFHDGPTAADIKLGWTLPSGATGRVSSSFSLAAATAQFDATEALQQVVTALGVLSAATFTGVVTRTEYRGTLRTTSSGRLVLRFAQSTATVGDTRILDDSRIKCTPI